MSEVSPHEIASGLPDAYGRLDNREVTIVTTALALTGVCCALLTVVATAAQAPEQGPAPGPATEARVQPTTETEETTDRRHRRVAKRREGPVIMVHRGASAFAPENSLEAYSAAMDYGADGCEVDIRRTKEGVLVLFHDDMLDRVTDGFGSVDEVSSQELWSLVSRWVGGRRLFAQPPTLDALLELARDRVMLLHLDIKQAGIDQEIARRLDAFDVWDHVVAVNRANAGELLKDPRLHLLSFKGPGLYERRRDWDLESVRAQLAEPGQMILVDDPRVAASVLGRPPFEPIPLTRTFRLTRAAEPQPEPGTPSRAVRSPTEASGFNAAAHISEVQKRVNPFDRDQLLTLAQAPVPALPDAGGDPALWRIRRERITERAWAAQCLADSRIRTKRAVRALEQLAQQPSPDTDWRFHGLDSASAIRALGALRSTSSAGQLIELFRRPGAAVQAGRGWSTNLPAWADFRWKMAVIPALGELPCRESKKFLQGYTRMDEASAQALGPPQFEEATVALLEQKLAWDEVERLLRSTNTAVRGTAVQECLRRLTDEREMALERAAPWALKLPRAKP